ncbi:MAG: hypothetical protein B7Z81_11015, partial [Acidocella sp. 20-61-6]
MPIWFITLACLWLTGGFIAAGAVALDLRRNPPKMPIMAPVWVITPLYFGPPGYFLYRALTRMEKKPFWAQVFTGTLHCGAGCTLGDICAEFAIFFAGISLAGSVFGTELISDFGLAFLLGIVFQYFSIAPMRGLALGPGILAAIKADAL